LVKISQEEVRGFHRGHGQYCGVNRLSMRMVGLKKGIKLQKLFR